MLYKEFNVCVFDTKVHQYYLCKFFYQCVDPKQTLNCLNEKHSLSC